MTRKPKIWMIVLLMGLATMILPLLAMLPLVGGGDNYGLLIVLFPYATVLLGLMEDHAGLLWFLMLVQFPIYGFFLSRSWIRGTFFNNFCILLLLHGSLAFGAVFIVAKR